MLISSLSGIYLWWPAGGVRRSGVRLPPRLRAAPQSALHVRHLGRDRARDAVVHRHLPRLSRCRSRGGGGLRRGLAVAARNPERRERRTRRSGRTTRRPSRVQRYPNATVIGLGFPAGPRGAYRVNLREAGDTTSRSGTVVFVDPRSRRCCTRSTARPAAAATRFSVAAHPARRRRLRRRGSLRDVPGRALAADLRGHRTHHVAALAQSSRCRDRIADRGRIEVVDYCATTACTSRG